MAFDLAFFKQFEGGNCSMHDIGGHSTDGKLILVEERKSMFIFNSKILQKVEKGTINVPYLIKKENMAIFRVDPFFLIADRKSLVMLCLIAPTKIN